MPIALENTEVKKNVVSKLSLTYMNAGSIKNKTTSIHDYIVQSNIDIMAVSETWLYANDEENAPYINKVTPCNYEMKHAASRKDGHIAGGVAIIFRKSLKVHIKNSSNFSCAMTDQFEYMVCDVFHNTDSRSKVTFVIVYRPPPSKRNNLKLKLFWKDWTKFMRKFASDHTEVVILGDLNFHLDDPNASSTKKFNSILNQLNLIQHISQPTHTAGHILDVLITKPDSKLMPESIAVHDPGIMNETGIVSLCHHYAVSCSFSYSKPSPTRKVIQYRNLRDINKEAFEADLAHAQLSSCLTKCSDVNEMVEIFDKCLLNLIDIHAPVITRNVIERPNTSWYTSDLLAGKRLKRQHERKWLKSGLEVHRILYRQQCAAFNKLLYRTRIQHTQNKTSACENNATKLHKVCKSILCLPKPKVMIEGCNSDEESANTLANFFRNKVRTIANDLEKEEECAQDQLSAYMKEVEERNVNPQISFSQFEHTSDEEIYKLISESNSKTCDLDIVPTRIFKSFSKSLAPAVTIIMNKSLKTGTVSTSYKKAIVIPSLKNPSLDSSDPLSYRPVSNLPYISKLLEKVVCKQLVNHLSAHNLLPSNQSAYRKNFSTETSLLNVSNNILCNLDKGR